MYIFNRIFNNLVNKICWFLLISIVGLTCFFLGLYYVDASTCSSFVGSTFSSTFTLATPITGTDAFYSHDKVRDTLPQLLNNNSIFVDNYGNFDDTYSFYQKFNYAVRQQTDQNYFTIYYQDYELLNTYACSNNRNKFYIFSIYTSTKANSGYPYYLWGFVYNFYVNIHIDTSTNEIILDSLSTPNTSYVNFSTQYNRFSSTPNWDYYSWNFPFIDSYNNFELITQMDDEKKVDFMAGISSYAYNSWNSYPNETLVLNSSQTPLSNFQTTFFGDEVIEDTGSSGGDSNNVDLSIIEGKLEETNEKLDHVNTKLEEIVNGIADSAVDLSDKIAGGVKDIIDTLSEGFIGLKESIEGLWNFFTENYIDESNFQKFFENFTNEDNGGISAIITIPLRLINSLMNEKSCAYLNLPIFGEDIGFPSGCFLWDDAPENVITIYQMFVCGLGSYAILRSLFKDIEKLKHPDESEVDILDL